MPFVYIIAPFGGLEFMSGGALRPQHRLYFSPDPQGQEALRPMFCFSAERSQLWSAGG